MASMSTSDDLLKDDDDDSNASVQENHPNGSNGADYGTGSTHSRKSRKRRGSYSSCDGELNEDLKKIHDTNAIICRLKNYEAEEPTGLSVLRSRLTSKKQPGRQSLENLLQWSNVPGSTTASLHEDVNEQLSRLKSACHDALVNFLHDCPSLINNNVKANQTKGKNEVASCVQHGKVKSDTDDDDDSCESFPSLREPSNGKVLATPIIPKDIIGPEKTQRKDRTSWSLLLLSLYKFLKLISNVVLMFLKLVLIIFIFMFILYCLMVLHKPTQALVSRHTQDLIYPFMRTIRFGSLPFVSRFPQFHELYEDACVLANPFFEMNDVSCWPCESVRHVIDLTGFSNFTSGYYHSGIPFIVKDAFVEQVGIDDLYKLYEEDEKLVGNVLLHSSQNEIQTLDDLVKVGVKTGHFYTGNLHVAWKINRAQYARQLRKYFPRPYYIPNSTEISVQHFLYIDEPAAGQYSLPITEFANVFVMQAEGQRLIVLVPVRNCRATCKAISVVLQPKDVLFYNWLFWNPISFPMRALEESNNLSITYVGSFY